MLYPFPVRWSDLNTSHVLGIVLALVFVWLSYRERPLLIATPIRGIRAAEAPTREDAPKPFHSRWRSLRRAWRETVLYWVSISMILTVGAFLIFSAFVWWEMGLNRQGLLDALALTRAIAALTFTIIALMQFELVAALKLVRTLPLTSSGCALLVLSYPLATLLGLSPLMLTLCVSFGTGLRPLTSFSIWLLILLSISPSVLAMVARFGVRVMLWGFVLPTSCAVILGVGVLVGLNARYGIVVAPIVAAAIAILLLVLVGLVGFWGLRYVIANCSAAYHQKLRVPESN